MLDLVEPPFDRPDDPPRPGRRARTAELALAISFALLALATMVVPDWLEAFGIEPDGGDGSFERALVVGLGLCSLLFLALAGRRWRRGRRSVAPAD